MKEEQNLTFCAFSCEGYSCNYACVLIKITYSCFAFSVGLVSLNPHHV